MQQILTTVDEAIEARKKNISELTCQREEAIKMLCHYDARIEKEKSMVIQLNSERNKLENSLSELHSLKFGNSAGLTNGPGNCNTAKANKLSNQLFENVFHEQNDAVDSH